MEHKICLDTDFLVDFLNNKPDAVKFIKEHQNHGLSSSIITLFELYHGAYLHKSSKQLALIEEIFSRLPLLNLSKEIVNEAGKISAFLEKSGQYMEFKDILIGTSAKLNGCQLKTNNVKHFQRIEGLKLV